MTLGKKILRKYSEESLKYPSPPPEEKLHENKKKYIDKFAHVPPKVDNESPRLDPFCYHRKLKARDVNNVNLFKDNLALVKFIRFAEFSGGRVDSRWTVCPKRSKLYYQRRKDFIDNIIEDNKRFHKFLITTPPKVETKQSHLKDWKLNRAKIIKQAKLPFILFPVIETDLCEDPVFRAAAGVQRKRVFIEYKIKNWHKLGVLEIELFNDICPKTCDLFLELLAGDNNGYGYMGSSIFRSFNNLKTIDKNAKTMLVSDTGLPSAANDILLKIVSSEGQIYTAYFSEETLLEQVKAKSIDHFYSNNENNNHRFKMVRVYNSATLHEMLTIGQEQLGNYEEILLIERITPDPGPLWDLGAVRAPQISTIAAATASLPIPESTMQQPNLQSLLSTNELTFELKKILISLVEAGAKLAAAGRNYETSLKQLIDALEEPKTTPSMPIQVITPEEIACRFNSDKEIEKKEYKNMSRVDLLKLFLDKFREWRRKVAEPPSGEAVATLLDLGFTVDQADEALKATGNNVPAAASYIVGERGSSIFELTDGLPNRNILQTLLKQPQIQRGLLNTRMLVAFISMVGQNGSAALWLNSPHGSPLLTQISRTYHSEKYCLAVNQFAQTTQVPSTSGQRH